MADWTEELFGRELVSLTDWYGIWLATFPLNLIAFIAIAIGLYLISQLIADFFPFIRRILNVIFLPFAVTHVWFHVNAIHELNRQSPGKIDQQFSIRNTFSVSQFSTERTSMMFLGLKDYRDVRKVAFAPFMPALVILFLLYLSTPLFFISPLLLIIHFYVLLGVVTTLMPTGADTYFVYQSALIRVQASPYYALWGIVVFLTFSFTEVLTTGQILVPIIYGLTGAVTYYGLFMVVVMWTNRDKDPEELAIYLSGSLEDEGRSRKDDDLTVITDLLDDNDLTVDLF